MCNGGAGLTTKSRAVNTRSLNANDGTGAHTWTYNWPGPLVTVPLGNDTAYTVGGVVGACSFFVLQEKYYQGAYTSNNLLKTVTRSYSSGIQNPRISYTGEDTAVDVVESAVTTTWANGKTAQVTLQYDSGNTFTFYDYVWETTTNYPLIYGSVTQSTGSDYGPNSQPGPVIHKVVSQYLWNSDSTYRDANLLNLPSSTQVL